MRSLVLVVTLVVFQAGPAESVCYIGSCRASECNGYRCNRCKDDFYLDTTSISWRDNCNVCPSSCSVCDGYDDCSECISGRYGYRCQSICTGCNQNICDKDDGSCTNGCIVGYYRETDGRCSQCPTRCSQCSDSNTCSDCKDVSDWGGTCQYTCYNCPNCSKSDGCSSGCSGSYYRFYNSTKGGYVCYKCRDKCTSCTGYNYCQSCSPKYWGTMCSNSCPNSCELCTSNTACSECETGYWGNFCQYSCSVCYRNTCSKTQGCTNGCINGYYMYLEKSGYEYHCKKCLDTCTTCSDSVSCDSCPSGFVGSQCQHDCSSCNGGLCNSATGMCTYICESDEYFKKESSGTGCFKCPDGCTRCSTATECTECVESKWGTICGIDCPDNCNNNQCDKGAGICSGGCVTGYFSRHNNHMCECNTNQCSNMEGNICKECSVYTWYPESSGCCPCSANCKDNECSTNGACNGCIDGKFGENCELNCQHKCADSLCYRNGSCISCHNAYYYGLSCGSHCRDSISRCNTCFGLSRDTTTCTSCWNGWYADGHNCKACSAHCMTNSNIYPKCDPFAGACKGYCATGWFGERCDVNCNVTNCQTCSSDDPNICEKCSNGFYSKTNYSCIACPSDCLMDTLCNKYNGSCSGGCEENWSGNRCDKPCPTECRQCDQFNKSSCSLCQEDSYGDSCEHTCNLGCVQQNQRKTCDKSNGTCNFDCKHTFWGNQCDKQCGEGCSGNACNRTTGQCLSQCHETHFGQACDSKCSGNCIPRTGRSCNVTDGYCLNGCQVGWFGRQCNVQCRQNCKDNACNRNNGSCTFGCIDGYTGSFCGQACPSVCRQCDQNNNSLSCSLCQEDFYGDSCEFNCSSGCVTRNQRQTCDKSNGTCNFDCKDEFWGDRCDKLCGKGCSGNKCNRNTGYCLSKCNDTHFGQMCDSQCSKNCIPSMERSCYEIDGFCRNGCHIGWFGSQCNDHCSNNCKGNVCDRNTGFCIAGCVDGFKGSMCMQALQSDGTSGPNTAAIGGGVGAVVAVLVIIVLIVVVVVLRRRLTRANANVEHTAHVDAVVSHCKGTDEINFKPAPDYQNLAIGTTFSTDRQAHDSIEFASTYQELNQDTRDGTEYSTLDEITPT